MNYSENVGRPVYLGEEKAPSGLGVPRNDEARLADQTPIATAEINLRPVNIEPLNSGYVVRVGCQTIAVETTEKLLVYLGEYLKDPVKFQAKWFSITDRNKLNFM
jgi:hypothetical protein